MGVGAWAILESVTGVLGIGEVEEEASRMGKHQSVANGDRIKPPFSRTSSTPLIDRSQGTCGAASDRHTGRGEDEYE